MSALGPTLPKPWNPYSQHKNFERTKVTAFCIFDGLFGTWQDGTVVVGIQGKHWFRLKKDPLKAGRYVAD
jgi:hypothetical protein